MHVDRSWLTIVVVVFGTKWFLAESSFSRARHIGGEVRFPGSTSSRLLFGLSAPIAVYGAGTVALSSTVRNDWWVSVVLACLAAIAIWMWPEEIITTAKGISQRGRFGIGKYGFSWSEVDYATEDPTNGNILVAPKSGKKIVHTRMHVGHDEFLQVVRRRCRMW